MLSSKNGLPPHVLFALDNVIRRVAEHLVGLIRPGKQSEVSFDSFVCFHLIDFVPATNPIAPITPSDASSTGLSNTRTPLFLSVSDGSNEEINRLHQEYTKLIQKNRK